MTDGTRILRTVAVPVVIALVFLFLVPKTCQKALGTRKLPRPSAPAATPPAASTDGALHIQSDSPDAPPSRPIRFPAGLDAQRAQYLIEIDSRFAEPYKVLLPKSGAVFELVDTTVADALVQAGYFEQAGSGYKPAPGSALHLDGLTETATAWVVPAAKRKFLRVSAAEDNGEGKAKIGFFWQWEPNDAGRALKSSFDVHEGRAEFVGVNGHPWDLTGITVDSQWH